MVKKGLLYSIPSLLILTAISVYGFITIPEGTQISSHFNIDGEVDDTTDRNFLLIGMPVFAVILMLVFAAIPAIDPRRRNVERSRGLYYAGWFGMFGILIMTHAMLVFSAAHNTVPDSRWMLAGVSILLIAIGNFMAKSRSTWFLGLRTPWTLSSEHAWTVANRLAGWLMVLTGIASLGLGIFQNEQTGLLTMIAGAVMSAIAGVVVSFFAWRSDPERVESRIR